MTFERSSLQHVKLWSTCVLFRRSFRLKLTSWAYPAININSCLQALTKDISTPEDIAPSALETIIFYCFMGYISALTYYLLLLLILQYDIWCNEATTITLKSKLLCSDSLKLQCFKLSADHVGSSTATAVNVGMSQADSFVTICSSI